MFPHPPCMVNKSEQGSTHLVFLQLNCINQWPYQKNEIKRWGGKINDNTGLRFILIFHHYKQNRNGWCLFPSLLEYSKNSTGKKQNVTTMWEIECNKYYTGEKR